MRQCLVTQQAINVTTICKMATADAIFTPRSLIPHAKTHHVPHFDHYGSPMVHPVMGKTISSYKHLMNNPATAEIWQTAFGKDFGGMAQVCNKTGQNRNNAMFVMTLNELHMHCKQGQNLLAETPSLTTDPKGRSQQNLDHDWGKSKL
jgi:hypothetical protein